MNILLDIASVKHILPGHVIYKTLSLHYLCVGTSLCSRVHASIVLVDAIALVTLVSSMYDDNDQRTDTGNISKYTALRRVVYLGV